MGVRVTLATDAAAASTLATFIAGAPEATRVWLPDQPSPYGGDTTPFFAGVLARPFDASAPSGLGATFEYDAEEVVAKPGAQTGIGLLALLRPLPGLTRSEVLRHWDEHIPLANVVHHKATSYRQFRFSLSPDAPDYAGFAILHFPSAEALRTGLYRNEEDVEAIRADVAEFAVGADTLFVTEYKRT